ncbi:hypothetical protein GCM10020000_63990 [Streptomyces olivoverticillatus]
MRLWLSPRVVTRRQLAHQHGRTLDLALRQGGPAEHREVPVEARTRRTASVTDRRHTWPAAHSYLIHETPHPYEAPGPGRVTLSPHRVTRAFAVPIHQPVKGVDEPGVNLS